MLDNAVNWDTVPAHATPLVTLTSWGLLLATAANLVLVSRMDAESGVVGGALTGLGHRGLVLALLAVGAGVLLVSACATAGFRRANHRRYQFWTAALVVDSLALAPAVLTVAGILVAALLCVVLGALLVVLLISALG